MKISKLCPKEKMESTASNLVSQLESGVPSRLHAHGPKANPGFRKGRGKKSCPVKPGGTEAKALGNPGSLRASRTRSRCRNEFSKHNYLFPAAAEQ